jgi:type II restriction enzyme
MLSAWSAETVVMAESDPFGPLPGFEEPPAHFESASQIARFQSEPWVQRNLFCPSCGETALERFPNNQPVADFYCANCAEQFELKSQAGRFGAKVVDGAYRTMRRRITSRQNPSLMLLRYDRASGPQDVTVIPKHFFVPAIIEERKPLASTARRAGWVGCNILVGQVPEIGRIPVVRDRRLLPKAAVLERWRRTLFLREAGLNARGWLVEVMKAVEALAKPEFTLAEVYASETRLRALFPANNNVRPKIRQQLQVLRDQGFLEFAGRGHYRLR